MFSFSSFVLFFSSFISSHAFPTSSHLPLFSSTSPPPLFLSPFPGSLPTWAGCGKHIETALAGIPVDQRCKCPRGTSAVRFTCSSFSSSSSAMIAYSYLHVHVFFPPHVRRGLSFLISFTLILHLLLFCLMSRRAASCRPDLLPLAPSLLTPPRMASAKPRLITCHLSRASCVTLDLAKLSS